MNQQQQQQPQQQPQQSGATVSTKLTWPAPPIYLMKNMDTLLFQQSQSIDEIKNRLNCIESGSLSVNDGGGYESETRVNLDDIENIKSTLTSDPEFVGGIVDNIMTNSNLSEIIEQIDAVQTENRELRELLYAQQKTINEMNIMLLKLFSQNQAPVYQNNTNAIGASTNTIGASTNTIGASTNTIGASTNAIGASTNAISEPHECEQELQECDQDLQEDDFSEDELQDQLVPNVELEIVDKT